MTTDTILGLGEYDECSGTWSAGSRTNSLKTSSSNALILFRDTKWGWANWEVSCKVAVKSSAAGEVFDARVYGAVEDTGSGYCSGTGIWLNRRGVSNGMYYELSTGEQHPWDTTSCTTDSAITTTEYITTLTLRHQDGRIIGIGGAGGIPNILGTSLTPSGDKYGFGTGTLGSNITYVEFYDFQVKNLGGSCGNAGYQCCGEATPAEMVLELSSTTSPSETFTNGGLYCTIDCSILDGTYIIPASHNNAVNCAGDGACQWFGDNEATVLIADQTCMGGPAPSDILVDLTVSITVSGLGVRSIAVNFGSYPFFNLTGSFTGLCTDDLSTAFTLTGTGKGGFGLPKCDSSGTIAIN